MTDIELLCYNDFYSNVIFPRRIPLSNPLLKHAFEEGRGASVADLSLNISDGSPLRRRRRSCIDLFFYFGLGFLNRP